MALTRSCRRVHDLIRYAAERTRQELLATLGGESSRGLHGRRRVRAYRAGRIHVPFRHRSTERCLTSLARPPTGGGMNCPLATTRSDVHYAIKCIVADASPSTRAAWSRSNSTSGRQRAEPGVPWSDGRPASYFGTPVRCDHACTRASCAHQVVRWVVRRLALHHLRGTFSEDRPDGGAASECLGGAGAALTHDGADALDNHAANCAIIPAETVEMNYPLRVERYSSWRDSGGPGTFRGGLGIRADTEFWPMSRFTLCRNRAGSPRVRAPRARWWAVWRVSAGFT